LGENTNLDVQQEIPMRKRGVRKKDTYIFIYICIHI
jgi:hypothetical protein